MNKMKVDEETDWMDGMDTLLAAKTDTKNEQYLDAIKPLYGMQKKMRVL